MSGDHDVCPECGDDMCDWQFFGGECEEVEPVSEAERWRSIALYLANCHAATAEYEGQLNMTTKITRKRLAAICDQAVRLLEGGVPDRTNNTGDVIQRCESASRLMKELTR